MPLRAAKQAPVHVEMDIDVYKTRVLFVVDDDIARATTWFRKTLPAKKFRPTRAIDDDSVEGMAFSYWNDNHTRTFVIWFRSFTAPMGYSRLAHECVHSAIHILEYIGFTPPMYSRYSEPLTYLVDCIMSQCLEALVARR